MILCQTDRLLIRTYEKRDAIDVQRVMGCSETYATTHMIPKDYPMKRAYWWFGFLASSHKNGTGYEFGMFDIYTGEYIGNIGLIAVNKSSRNASITYIIHPEKWGQNYATEGGSAMLSFGFERLELEKVSGACMVHNIGSARVMEKLGFKSEGISRHDILKDGKYIDIAKYSILRDEFFGEGNENR